MSNREELTFNSLEQVLAHFPYVVTAELLTVKELALHEAGMIQRAQARERRSASDWGMPEHGSAVDYLELRGAMLTANGGPTDPKDTGPLYINRSYLPQREQWHDFSVGDVVTYFFQNINMTVDFRSRTQKTETRIVCIYNHETHILTQCQDHFLNVNPLDVSGRNPLPLMAHNQAWYASNAVCFLIENNFIPRQGKHPRPINDQLTNFEWSNEAASGDGCLGCLGDSLIAIILVIVGLIGLFILLSQLGYFGPVKLF